jgi:hypothetical protein
MEIVTRASRSFCGDEGVGTAIRKEAQQRRGEFASAIPTRELAMQRFRNEDIAEMQFSSRSGRIQHFNQERPLVTRQTTSKGTRPIDRVARLAA